MSGISSSSLPQYLSNQTSFRDSLVKLASEKSLSVNAQGNLIPTGVLNNLFKGGSVTNNSRLVEFKIMEFLVHGKKWLKPEDIKLVEQLARKAGLFINSKESYEQHKELSLLVNLIAKEVLEQEPLSEKDCQDLCKAFQTHYRNTLKPFSKQCEQITKNFAELFQIQNENQEQEIWESVGDEATSDQGNADAEEHQGEPKKSSVNQPEVRFEKDAAAEALAEQNRLNAVASFAIPDSHTDSANNQSPSAANGKNGASKTAPTLRRARKPIIENDATKQQLKNVALGTLGAAVGLSAAYLGYKKLMEGDVTPIVEPNYLGITTVVAGALAVIGVPLYFLRGNEKQLNDPNNKPGAKKFGINGLNHFDDKALKNEGTHTYPFNGTPTAQELQKQEAAARVQQQKDQVIEKLRNNSDATEDEARAMANKFSLAELDKVIVLPNEKIQAGVNGYRQEVQKLQAQVEASLLEQQQQLQQPVDPQNQLDDPILQQLMQQANIQLDGHAGNQGQEIQGVEEQAELSQQLKEQEEAKQALQLKEQEEAKQALLLKEQEEAKQALLLKEQEEAKQALLLKEQEEAKQTLLLKEQEEAKQALLLKEQEEAKQALLLKEQEEAKQTLLLKEQEEAKQALLLKEQEEAKQALLLKEQEEGKVQLSNSENALTGRTENDQSIEKLVEQGNVLHISQNAKDTLLGILAVGPTNIEQIQKVIINDQPIVDQPEVNEKTEQFISKEEVSDKAQQQKDQKQQELEQKRDQAFEIFKSHDIEENVAKEIAESFKGHQLNAFLQLKQSKEEIQELVDDHLKAKAKYAQVVQLEEKVEVVINQQLQTGSLEDQADVEQQQHSNVNNTNNQQSNLVDDQSDKDLTANDSLVKNSSSSSLSSSNIKRTSSSNISKAQSSEELSIINKLIGTSQSPTKGKQVYISILKMMSQNEFNLLETLFEQGVTEDHRLAGVFNYKNFTDAFAVVNKEKNPEKVEVKAVNTVETSDYTKEEKQTANSFMVSGLKRDKAITMLQNLGTEYLKKLDDLFKTSIDEKNPWSAVQKQKTSFANWIGMALDDKNGILEKADSSQSPFKAITGKK